MGGQLAVSAMVSEKDSMTDLEKPESECTALHAEFQDY